VKSPEVRVLAGRWKGRRLGAGPRARPTSSRARAALFDILGESVVGANVLDLFAGSGAVGIEAVSRGAREAVLVEPDASGLLGAVQRLDAAPEVRILAEEARSAVRRLAREGDRFGLIFADPPYDRPLDRDLLAAIPGLLEPTGSFVLQQDEKRPAPEIAGLRFERRRAYGRNVFLFFGMR
jgi:16S rRNA (guanine(966)-N(2))-methyltransferase RsmD